MTDPIKITVHTMMSGESFWSQDVQVVDGASIKVVVDGPLSALQRRNDELTAFIERCATTERETIDGAKLRQAARDVLGVGVAVEPTQGEPG